MIVIETSCFPKSFTISRDGKTPIDNGDFSLWFSTREEAETKLKKMQEKDKIHVKPIRIMNVDLIEWKYKSCTAEFGYGPDWVTLSYIESTEKRQGHATTLLKTAKKYFEDKNMKFGGSIALNPGMRRIYVRLGITEYK